NDSDCEGELLTAALATGPTHGIVTLSADGSFTYTPFTNFGSPATAIDSFTYRASDGQSLSNIATVTITVQHVHQPPVATNDAYLIPDDTSLALAVPGVLANDTDVDFAEISAVLVSNPSHGSLVLIPNGAFAYTPNAHYFGTDSFTYQADDGE